MRHFYLLLATAVIGLSSKAQLFKQDFSSSATLTDYYGGTLNNGKFNGITDGGTSMGIAVTGGALTFTKTGGSDGSYQRTTNLTPAPGIVMYQLDINVSDVNQTGNNSLYFYVGSGFGNDADLESTSNNMFGLTHSFFAVDFMNTTSNEIRFRSGAGATSSNFSGNNRITFVINNSASAVTYSSPNALVNKGLDTVAVDTYDLYVGNTRIFNNVPASKTDVAIDEFKFVYATSNGVVSLDNILFDLPPATPTSTTPVFVSNTSFQARWNAVTGSATGYKLDVSTDNTFSNPLAFVPGYNGKYISGLSTITETVTGVTTGVNYFYRVKGTQQYGAVGSETNLISGNVSATQAVGALLPIKLSSFTGSMKNKKAELVWVTELESHSDRYEIERSADGKNFTKVGTVAAIGKASSYNFADATIGSGKSFYRLRSVDIDGKYEFSHTVMINNKGIAVVDIYPNPVVGTVTVQYPKVETSTVLNIVSINGAKIKSFVLPANSTQSKISVESLKAGSYILVYDNGVERITTKFTKQ